MSLAQLKTVQRAQKDQGDCYKCHDALPAGGPYRYFRAGFRGPKRKVCMKSECTPRTSEMESSKLAGVYESQELAQQAVEDADTVQLVIDAVADCASAVNEVIGEYNDAFIETPMLEDQLQETVDRLEDYVNSLEGFMPDEPEEGDDEERLEELLQAAKDEALDEIASLEV